MIPVDIISTLIAVFSKYLEESFSKEIEEQNREMILDEYVKRSNISSDEMLSSPKDIVNDSILQSSLILDRYKEEKDETYDNKEENNNKISEVDIVMIFALPEERSAAFRAFNFSSSLDIYDETGKFYYQKTAYKNLKIISITQTKMGISMASSLTTRAIMTFQPKMVVMTGICAGREGATDIGDVLLASSVYDYTAGKITEQGKVLRPDPIPCNSIFLNIYGQRTEHENDKKLNSVIDELWEQDRERPTNHTKVHQKSLGTGTSVVADSKVIEEAIKSQDNLYGIDMEGYGVAVAAFELGVPFLIVKGIQDFADGEKTSTENKNNAREYASLASAVLARLIVPEFITRNH